jgi:nicotinamide-nucleotide amidase
LQGVAESKMAVMLDSWEKELPENVSLAYLPSPGLLRLRVTVTSNNKSHATQLLEKYSKQLSALTSNYIFGYDNESLEEVVGKLLATKNQTLSIAESCTGGSLSQMITSVPGSSEYFKGAIIAYSNKVKIYDLQVDPSLILEHGAVSQFVTEAMVQGCLERFKTDYAIAVSGIAGPGGGTETKPVGTVWITVGCQDAIVSERFQFGDERIRNITKASLTALNMLRKLVISR